MLDVLFCALVMYAVSTSALIIAMVRDAWQATIFFAITAVASIILSAGITHLAMLAGIISK